MASTATKLPPVTASLYRGIYRILRGFDKSPQWKGLVSFDHRIQAEEHRLYDSWLRKDFLRGATVFLPDGPDNTASFCEAWRNVLNQHIQPAGQEEGQEISTSEHVEEKFP